MAGWPGFIRSLRWCLDGCLLEQLFNLQSLGRSEPILTFRVKALMRVWSFCGQLGWVRRKGRRKPQAT
jgi:hypothetical protein